MSLKTANLRNSKCTLCSLHKKAKTICVMGDGAARLPVMVVGEAPGSQEDLMGRPFVGRAGKLLRSTLQSVGLPPNKLYITNVVKCFPNGTPTSDEAETCSAAYLEKEIDLLAPKVTLALGGTAAGALVDGSGSVSQLRGKLHKGYDDGLVFVAWHPAYVLRNRKAESIFRDDLKTFAALVTIELGLEYVED